MNEYGLGRLDKPEDDRDWPVGVLRGMIERGEAIPVVWDCPVVLNQASSQHCVGFAWAAFKACAQSNAPADASITDDEGHRIYRACKVIEQNPLGEEGAYLRSGAKVMKAEGVIDAYAFGNFEEVQLWCPRYGPVVMGTNWYESMFDPDSHGVITISGVRRGGHAYIRLAEKQKPADNGYLNSWDGWGADGRFYMSDENEYRLLEEGGEAIMAVKLIPKPPLPWPELEQYSLSEDDRLSILAAYHQGILKGYPDGSFHYEDRVTNYQLGAVMVRLGLLRKNIWEEPADWLLPCTRGFAHENIPALPFQDERWGESLLRGQLLLLVGRMVRGGELK